MPRTVVVMQPTYLPWLGYFELMAQADIFVFLDCVQFERRSWQSRNQLKNSNDETYWLTVPVASHPRTACISEIMLSPEWPQWRHKHLRSMQMSLGKASYYKSLFPDIEELMLRDHDRLTQLTVNGILLLAEYLQLKPQFILASELSPKGQKAELILDICKTLGAQRYYSAMGSKDYLEQEASSFISAGIELEFQHWVHPTYSQLGKHFVSHLSVIDVLMNAGPQVARSLLTANSDSTNKAIALRVENMTAR
jgi:WbqC-like protein family